MSCVARYGRHHIKLKFILCLIFLIFLIFRLRIPRSWVDIPQPTTGLAFECNFLEKKYLTCIWLHFTNEIVKSDASCWVVRGIWHFNVILLIAIRRVKTFERAKNSILSAFPPLHRCKGNSLKNPLTKPIKNSILLSKSFAVSTACSTTSLPSCRCCSRFFLPLEVIKVLIKVGLHQHNTPRGDAKFRSIKVNNIFSSASSALVEF